MFVQDFMTTDIITVNPHTGHPEAMRLMRQHKIRRLPVMDDGKLVGMVVEKDLLSTQPSPATSLSIHEIYYLLERLEVRQFMSHPVFTVGVDCPLEDAARIMITHKIGCLPVMDKKKLVGIITETDIFKGLVEVLGGNELGVRLTIKLPEAVGQLSRVTSILAEAGGNIVAVTTAHEEDHFRKVTVKVCGADEKEITNRLKEANFEILAIQANKTPFQAKQVG